MTAWVLLILPLNSFTTGTTELLPRIAEIGKVTPVENLLVVAVANLPDSTVQNLRACPLEIDSLALETTTCTQISCP